MKWILADWLHWMFALANAIETFPAMLDNMLKWVDFLNLEEVLLLKYDGNKLLVLLILAIFIAHGLVTWINLVRQIFWF